MKTPKHTKKELALMRDAYQAGFDFALQAKPKPAKNGMPYTPDHYHEVADRTHIIIENIDTHLCCSFKEDAHVRKEAMKAIEILWELYQYAGAKF